MLREEGEDTWKSVEGGRAKEEDRPSEAAPARPDAWLCKYLPGASVFGECMLKNSFRELIMDTSRGSQWFNCCPTWLTANNIA